MKRQRTATTTATRRKDAPKVDYVKEAGSLPSLSKDELEDAAHRFREDIHAPSQRSVVKAKLGTLEKAAGMFGMSLFPPSLERIQAIGTILKAGRYRSAETYLGIYKAEAERRGFRWTELEARAAKDAKRSCQRGIGGLPGGWEPWVGHGPVGPRNLVVLGSWFMLREVEAANTLAKDITIQLVNGKPKVTWMLPASKTDQRAVGVARSHGCSCREEPVPSCPAHAAWDHACRLKEQFGEGYLDRPFFPDMRGQVCSKEAVAATLSEAAVKLSVPVETASGKITGHTMRVTGAQGLAAGGLDLWAIQLLGRWGSMAVKTYVREAHLEQAEGWARRVGQNMDLEDLVANVAAKVSSCNPPFKQVAGEGPHPFKQVAGEGVPGQKDLWDVTLKAAKDTIEELVKDDVSGRELRTDQVVPEALAIEAVALQSKEVDKQEAVISDKGIVHEVLLGPPAVCKDLAVSSCGWRFGNSSGTTLLKRSELPRTYKSLCGRNASRRRGSKPKTSLGSSWVKLDACKRVVAGMVVVSGAVRWGACAGLPPPASTKFSLHTPMGGKGRRV